ncbi:sulfite exporter TauE/SafE family protein [Thalassospira povalilytica]|uniref:Sulfite exporter TauE/SafE family protein n=1 Tax=Thalassospira povalilytica TaxID=732237 RepID=A0ABX4R925_9PROT|nr:sulfite exporter TauE/SafE family protein [Thalassospira povalilytica]PKR50108.1 sulfite exporter TauE/SafE family protein [Thalassospira povalilytica]
MDEQQVLIRILESGWAQCAEILRDDGGVILSALIAGLVGSVTHCVGMCGPFVISQVTSRMEQLPVDKMTELHRLTGAALLPYQFGRLTTYCLLGGLAGFFADGITALTRIWWIGPVLLVLAGVFFLIFGIMGLLPHLGGLLPTTRDSRWWNRVFGDRLRPLFAAPFGFRGYALGVMLGFIPCGLVYGALVLAAATGVALNGAVVMLVFGLGTVPMLFVTGFVGQYAARRFRGLMVPVGRGLMIVNGLILFALAAQAVV